MRAVVQRVNSSSVKVNKEVIGSIDKGLMILLGITHEDTIEDVNYLVDKIINLRIFEDENDKMNLSLIDKKGELLVVSQFTLYGDSRRGKRPSFSDAARPELAIPLYEKFVEKAKSYNIKVETGEFAAHMVVDIENDGPVTMLLDSKKNF